MNQPQIANRRSKMLTRRLSSLRDALWGVAPASSLTTPSSLATRSSLAPVACVFEALDKRQLMSVSMTDGHLVVIGTDADDTIMFSLNATQKGVLNVNNNGVVSRFDVSSIVTITAYGNQGNDFIHVNEGKGGISIPVLFGGGKGNDSVAGGGAGDTLIGGMDNDLLIGRFGPDLLDGGEGNDSITGDTGHDTILGGEGDDAISGGRGLNVVDAGTGQTPASATGTFSPPTPRAGQLVQPNVFVSTVTGYDPSQIRKAYEFGNLSDASFTNRGEGEYIAIVNAFSYPTLINDLSVFSSTFGLPQPSADNIEVFYQRGRPGAVDAGWALEAALDVQWAHAIAPDAKKLMYFADSNLTIDIYATIRQAAERLTSLGGGVMSLSLGQIEAPAGAAVYIALDEIFQAYPSVTFVAANGNQAGTVSYPATSPNVLAVGGTRIALDQDGNRLGDEIAVPWASGGVSSVFAVPSYQQGLLGGALTTRGTPDVSYNAEDYATFITTTFGQGNTGWFPGGVAGTSAAAPQWAALIALANEKRTDNGLAPIGADVHEMLYAQLGDNTVLRDITVGSQFDPFQAIQINPALTGYDLSTGIGTPRAGALIDRLSNTTSNFIDREFDWTTTFYTSSNISTIPQTASGSGRARGGSSIDLLFTYEPRAGSQFSTVQIAGTDLIRTQEGRVYGYGTISYTSVQLGYPILVIPAAVFFDGTVSSSGSLDINFYMVDELGAALPVNPFEMTREGLLVSARGEIET